MDNHKDLIHIDGVFKEMRNGEEQEPSGAWMRMKDLLDKEIPVGAAVARNGSFRRYFIPLMALLLLGGGGAAYYELNKRQPAEDIQAGVTPTSPAAHPGQSINPDQAAKHTDINGNTTAGNARNEAQSRTNTTASAASHLKTAAGRNNAASGKQNTGTATAVNDGNSATGKTRNSNVAGNSRPASGQEFASLGVSTRTSSSSQPAKGGKTAQHDNKNNSAAKPFEEQRIIETLVPKKQSTGTIAAAPATPAALSAAANIKDLKIVAGTLNNRKIIQATDGNLYEEKRDTFKRIDLVEKTVVASGNNNGPVKKILDTVAVTRVERISYVPLTPIEALAVRRLKVENSTMGKVIPVASLNTRTTSSEMVNLVPLSHYKVGSRRVDPGKFNQLIQNTSKGIANYFDGSHNFYMALLAGGNVSFGNPTAFGMQFGIAGLYSLSERLTLSAELRYVNHYFSNYSIQDQSITFDNVNSQQNGLEWLFTGSQQTATSKYKVNSYGMLEFPLTLSYNLGRVSVFGGADFAYAFPIQWSKETTFNTIEVQQVRSQNQNPFLNSAFKLNEQTDFSSRFGVGYVWGLNYDLSRKISLDARVSQILWDNNKGNTDAINRLFRVPTLQFSLGYYFGRKDKVVYIMDRK